MTERGPALVRIALFSLLFGAFGLALLQPAQAGTAEAPEIQDPAGDQAAGGQVGLEGQTATGVDVVSAWVHNETADAIQFSIRVTGSVSGAGASQSGNTVVTGQDTYTFGFTIAGTAYEAQVRVDFNFRGTKAGVTDSFVLSGSVATMTVLKSAIGDPGADAEMTSTFARAERRVPPATVVTISDRAPNGAAFGANYIFVGGAGGNSTLPGDSDNDMLNDTCEQEFFGGLNGTNNATEDPDGDGLTNGQECALNPRTDPTKADSDGDGVNDKDDPFPTDPTKGGTSGSQTQTGSGTTSTSQSSSASGTGSGSGTGSQSSSGTKQDAGAPTDLAEAVDRLQSDLDYLGTSAGGMAAVLILAILALAVRWSL